MKASVGQDVCLCGSSGFMAGICVDIDGFFWPGHGYRRSLSYAERHDPVTRWQRVAERARARAWRRANAGHPLFVQADLAVTVLEARVAPHWSWT